ncbi:hypothetical protein B5K08_05955 [Rhizobium leguminosarum bv. trifolii]|uniref:Uncharacterized protein n=1 Tax=Rhizobium leguminosarum bv. trifolii TaxID=386 RepID=A0A3E1BXZ8_RHILT|nr:MULTISPECIES: hypothetical protein [Rhizobium]ANM09629.1 hypothetical protein AMK05_CH01205 [Rhizobium sp. N324]ANM16098.1 hypothetical protein AMK06_CH01164 [Rhizobium sp. N541]ANM22484.1 hypothetical protein AMK07_CH01162 [Rhizobium sp. N941]OYD03198.1 hypothetical protein AMK08_CH101200 [Rhizobium sp. N4311]RFB97851.1 hypothetical protein B5K08_05955 [Rhizobium leguminosarum bv. trifolii]
MRLVKHKRRVLARSLSMWCVYAAGFLEVVPYIVPYLDDWIPKWLSILFLAASPIARLIHQPALKENDNDR